MQPFKDIARKLVLLRMSKLGSYADKMMGKMMTPIILLSNYVQIKPRLSVLVGALKLYKFSNTLVESFCFLIVSEILEKLHS